MEGYGTLKLIGLEFDEKTILNRVNITGNDFILNKIGACKRIDDSTIVYKLVHKEVEPLHFLIFVDPTSNIIKNVF